MPRHHTAGAIQHYLRSHPKYESNPRSVGVCDQVRNPCFGEWHGGEAAAGFKGHHCIVKRAESGGIGRLKRPADATGACNLQGATFRPEIARTDCVSSHFHGSRVPSVIQCPSGGSRQVACHASVGRVAASGIPCGCHSQRAGAAVAEAPPRLGARPEQNQPKERECPCA